MNIIIKCFAAIFLTTGLFLLMGYLITPSAATPDALPETAKIDITRQLREERSDKLRRQPPPPPVQEQTPPPPPLLTAVSKNTKTDLVIEKISTRIPPPADGLVIDNRQATPTLRIPPQYPQAEVSRGDEGWVLVEFTITAEGNVADVVVVESEGGRGGFEREAVRAVKRWKYEPKLSAGKAVPQYQIREIFRFQIQEN